MGFGFPGNSYNKKSVLSVRDPGSIPGSGRSLGDAHTSTLDWRIPWTEESGRLESMG